MNVLRGIITRLTHNLASERLFPTLPTITFRPESPTCPRCGAKMKVLKTTTKPVATLAIGDFIAREVTYSCSLCGLVVGSQELKQLVPVRCNIGYDVLVAVGQAFFLDSVDNQQIVAGLAEKHITISKSEISYLAKKFIIYLSLLHKKVQKETRDFLSIQGGYILHLDGTCDGDSPHLISVLDGITEIVLDNTKVSTENADELIPFLEGIKTAYGDPVAVVSDMGKGIARAVKEVFPQVSIFICHYHFLKAVGKNLLGEEHDSIRKRLKNYGIQGILRKRVRTLHATIACSPPQLIQTFIRIFETEEELIPGNCEGLPQLIIHTLLVWVLAGKHQGQGCGFPFDQPYLSFYQRLVKAYTLLGTVGFASACKTAKEKKLYTAIRRDLKPVIRDSVLKTASVKMQEKAAVFSRLRAAMRITLPENKRGLNDTGEPCSMKTIENEVKKFRLRLSRDTNLMKDKAYQRLLGTITEYWDKLFCDPLIIETPAGKMLIQPQRTNNLLEQFFRTFMRTYRKKNGFQAVTRVLKAMLEDTPLVMNLRNKDFMNILLDGRQTLGERFADIDAEIVRSHLNKLSTNAYPVSHKLKKLINAPTFLESLSSLIKRKVS